MSKKYSKDKYLFSVIMPIYNVEDFLEESIDSVIKQTIGFEKSIQLVLVNDGSPDRSGEICKKYADQYPDNIIYVLKENGGVSSARNEGISYASGTYINFFDSDDVWADDAFEKAAAFFEKHGEEIDVVSTRTRYFGKREGFGHYLDFQYTQDRVADVYSEYSAIQMAVNNVFIRKSALGEQRFDTRLQVSEDSIFIAKIILQRGKYGLLRSAVYHYRKRSLGGSALDNRTKNRSWYFDTIEFCYRELFRYSEEKYGDVIPFLQYHVMNDIQWRLSMRVSDELEKSEVERYTAELKGLLQKIDDTIIMEQKSINFAYKLYALKLKYGKNVLKEAERQANWYIFNNVKIFNVSAPSRFRIDFIEIRDGNLKLKGFCELGIVDGGKQSIFWKDETNRLHPVVMDQCAGWQYKNFLGETIFNGLSFHLTIPLHEKMKITFVMQPDDNEPVVLKPFWGVGAKVSKEMKQSYYAAERYLIKLNNHALNVYGNQKKTRMASEIRYCRELANKRDSKLAWTHFVSRGKGRTQNTGIWIIVDKQAASGENVETLINYLDQQNLDEVKKIYFVGEKDVIEMAGLKQHNPALLELGKDHADKVFLQADRVITTRPGTRGLIDLKDTVELMKNLYTFDCVYLV